MENKSAVPILFPVEPSEFWAQIRRIIQEEIAQVQRPVTDASLLTQTPGLSEKPLYKISEVCMLFRVSRPTIYEWVKHGKLKPYKIRSRVYFLGKDIQNLLCSGT